MFYKSLRTFWETKGVMIYIVMHIASYFTLNTGDKYVNYENQM